MQKNGILSLVTKFRSHLQTPLLSSKVTDIHDEINSRIGSLSAPSKMPGYSWSISAKHCIIGNKLALIPGTPCANCYAKKNRYMFPNVQTAQERRLQAWKEDLDWVLLMTIRILLRKNPYFRWFDSGDLQSLKMLEDINQVAANTDGYVAHWLPTQERKLVSMLSQIHPNLTIRVSSTKINHIQTTSIKNVCTSSVSNELNPISGWVCPSRMQKNKCGVCRACWDRQIPVVVYIEH